MKKTLFTLLMTLCCVTSLAQTQQGIVKTPTRRNINGTITQGQYIANATVGILFANNNAKQSYVSGNKGTFSFSASFPYYVTSVTANKGTYTFLDADFSKKQRTYSANAVEVLVDDPDLLVKVREEAVAYTRNIIRKQNRVMEDEIEALKEANKITTAEYNKRNRELLKFRQSSEAIVQQIAEVYATTDFDKLDEFNQQLLALVEEGDFEKADSLLKTQGSKEELFKKIKDTDEAIKITEEHTQKAKELNNKEKEALSQRLYSEHLMWLQKPMMQDSALYCLKMRAELDTTNVSWNYDAANLLSQQCFWLQSFDYYERALRHVQDSLKKTDVLYSYGYALWRHGDMDNAKEMYLRTLSCDPRLTPNDFMYSDAALAFHYNSLAVSSSNNDEFGKYAKLALELYRKLGDKYHIAMNSNNVGNYYIRKGDLQKGLEYYVEAYSLDKELHNDHPSNESFLSSLAWMERILGETYLQIDSIQEAKKILSESRRHYEMLAKNDLNQYRVFLVDVDKSLVELYAVFSLNDSVYSTRERLNENLKILYERDPEKYTEDYYVNLLSLLHLQGRTEECIMISKEMIANYETLSGRLLYSSNNAPHVIRAHLRSHAMNEDFLSLEYFTDRLRRLTVTDSLMANDIDWYMMGDAYYDLYCLYYATGDLHTSAMYGEKSLQAFVKMTEKVPSANMYREMMLLHADMDKIEQYDLSLESALKLYKELYLSQPSMYINDVVELQNRKVWRLLVNGKVDDALDLEQKTYAMDESNETSKAYLAECYNNKALEYANSSDFDNAYKSIDKAISMLPDNANFYDSKGEILLMQGKNTEALEMWKNVMELNPNFLDDYPEGTNLSNGLRKLGLIK